MGIDVKERLLEVVEVLCADDSLVLETRQDLALIRSQMENEIIPRPTTKQWDGEGLPPAGCECEYFDRMSEEWERVFVVAHHCKSGEAIFSESLTGGILYYGGSSEFRPIKSAAERERDELHQDLLGILPFCEYTDAQIKEMAEIMYVQGYRKPDAGMLRKREG